MVVDGVLKEFVADFEGGVVAGPEGFAALCVHVEANGGIFG